MSCGCVPWRGRACDKVVAGAIKSSLPACRFPIRFPATATRLQRGDACSVLRKTAFSPRWARGPRWESCCGAIGCRSAARASSIANPIKPIRLMGEDLVLYKDLGGQFGLLDRHCPHRRADLAYGFVEPTGIRCNYHGWLMDEAGRCIEQPYDDTVNPRSRAKERCSTKAYPVKECAGLLWAYMGPQPVPELPIWEPFTWENGFREVVLSDVPCNWFQCQENSCDPVHFEWMHDNWSLRLSGKTGPYASQAPQAQVRGVRLRLHLQARARGFRRARSVLDRGAGRAVAERLLSRQSFRMARAGRRREYASASRGSSCACRRGGSPTCRTRFRPG